MSEYFGLIVVSETQTVSLPIVPFLCKLCRIKSPTTYFRCILYPHSGILVFSISFRNSLLHSTHDTDLSVSIKVDSMMRPDRQRSRVQGAYHLKSEIKCCCKPVQFSPHKEVMRIAHQWVRTIRISRCMKYPLRLIRLCQLIFQPLRASEIRQCRSWWVSSIPFMCMFLRQL